MRRPPHVSTVRAALLSLPMCYASITMSHSIRVMDLGRLDYEAALAVQERILEAKTRGAMGTRGAADDCLILVEHPHVITTGRREARTHILAPGGVPVHATSRGGDVTYHGPGQLVAYPIIDLKSKLRRAVHRYLDDLEQVIIDVLGSIGLEGARRPPFTGVWTGDRKICAIGIAVRRGVTYHGAALNVAPDLSYFRRIVPCGLEWAQVTSIEREAGRSIEMETVKHLLVQGFCRRFGYDGRVRDGDGDATEPATGSGSARCYF